jgi:hypothetical protein
MKTILREFLRQCGNSDKKIGSAFAFLVMTVTDETCITKIYAGRIGSMPKWKLLVLIDGAAAWRYSPQSADVMLITKLSTIFDTDHINSIFTR